jgi:2-phosphoglycerate kinase
MSHRRHAAPLPLGGEDGLPYSKGLMARALIAAGVTAVRAYDLASRIDRELTETGRDSIELERCREVAQEVLGDAEGGAAIDRLLRFRDLQELDLPTGTGKSTVATEAAHRLGITRVTSTDFVRQTMRAFFSMDFMPSIHYSSFEADQALRVPEDAEDPVISGFLEQTRNVAVGVQASIDRALEEGWSMVLEGVHLVPGLVPQRPVQGALVVQCILTIDAEDAHASHFWVRDLSSEGVRPVDKYLDRLPDIRRVQELIVRRAERAGVPVIENTNVEASIRTVMDLVLEGASRLEAVS